MTALLATRLVLLAVLLAQAPTDADRTRARRSPVVDVFEASRNAVVSISSTQIISSRRYSTGIDRLFEEFFDMPPARPRYYTSTSLGSGFVIHPAGYIVTNAHVVANTAERKVTFADKRIFDARIVAIDSPNDLAVLKIDPPSPLQAIRLGRSDDLMVGETVVAIGNPLGYQQTVTSGVISAIDREVQIDAEHAFKNLIQTDASINPGNSGGPLLNILGELIGINTAIRGDAQNIGFAIPVEQLTTQLPEMLDVEHLRPVMLGMKVAGRDEARVVELAPDSPAAEAGLRVGDRVVQVDGVPIGRGLDFYFALVEKSEGVPINLILDRDGKNQRAQLTIRPLPPPDGQRLAAALFGFDLRELTPDEFRRLGLRPGSGVLIVGIERGSPAANIGLRAGDIITSFGRYFVRSLDDVGSLLSEMDPGVRVDVGGLRLEGDELWRITGTLRARNP